MAQLRGSLAVALGLNTAVVAVEVVAGVRSDSLTLLMDAVHNGSAAVGLALLAVAYSTKRGLSRDALRSANVVKALGVIALGAVFLWYALARLIFHPHVATGMAPLTAGLLAALGNAGAARALRMAAREDGVIRLAYVHKRRDVLTSLIPVGAGALILATKSALIDPVVTLAMLVIVVVSAFLALAGAGFEALWPDRIGCHHDA